MRVKFNLLSVRHPLQMLRYFYIDRQGTLSFILVCVQSAQVLAINTFLQTYPQRNDLKIIENVIFANIPHKQLVSLSVLSESTRQICL